MTTVPQTPARWLTEAEIEAFHTDGAVVLRDVISAQWLAQIEEGVEYVLAHPSVLAEATAVLGGGGFSGDAFMWKTHQVFHDFIHHSPAARLAQQLFGSRRINAFYDQIFAKPAGNGKPTPFHEDVSSWPVSGDQLCAMWIALDPCTPDQAALQVVRGSHRWPPGRAIPVTPTAADLQLAGQSGDRDAEVTELLSWELEPGDLVLFHPRAVHGATGTGSERGRRAFVSRWAGDDVVFDPRHAVLPLLWEHGLKPGDPIGGSMFPQ
ncbi:MAG: phytanoyl-CoA dioxygenase family protein, partial [Jatrophihabitantaceae bacterium]